MRTIPISAARRIVNAATTLGAGPQHGPRPPLGSSNRLRPMFGAQKAAAAVRKHFGGSIALVVDGSDVWGCKPQNGEQVSQDKQWCCPAPAPYQFAGQTIQPRTGPCRPSANQGAADFVLMNELSGRPVAPSSGRTSGGFRRR